MKAKERVRVPNSHSKTAVGRWLRRLNNIVPRVNPKDRPDDSHFTAIRRLSMALGPNGDDVDDLEKVAVDRHSTHELFTQRRTEDR